jgi:hypothetical protein
MQSSNAFATVRQGIAQSAFEVVSIVKGGIGISPATVFLQEEEEEVDGEGGSTAASNNFKRECFHHGVSKNNIPLPSLRYLDVKFGSISEDEVIPLLKVNYTSEEKLFGSPLWL